MKYLRTKSRLLNERGSMIEVPLLAAIGVLALAIAVPSFAHGKYLSAGLWGVPGLACIGLLVWHRWRDRIKQFYKGASEKRP